MLFRSGDTAAVLQMPRQLCGEPFVCKGCRRAGSPADDRGTHTGEPAEAEGIYGEDDGLLGGYAFVFYLILKAFLPLRENRVLKIVAFLVCGYLADTIIYSNDLGGLLGTMLAFFVYILLCLIFMIPCRQRSVYGIWNHSRIIIVSVLRTKNVSVQSITI